MIFSIGEKNDGSDEMAQAILKKFNLQQSGEDFVTNLHRDSQKSMLELISLTIFTYKPVPQSLERYSNFSEKISVIDDSSVTLVGHTDESKNSIGRMSSQKIAKKLAEHYGENKASLQDVYLLGCEITEKFANQLLYGLNNQGFTNPKLTIYVPPIPNYATETSLEVCTQAGEALQFRIGTIEAIAISENKKRTSIFNQESFETYKDTCNIKCKKITKNKTHDVQENTINDSMLEKIAQILYILFGFNTLRINKLNAIFTQERCVIEKKRLAVADMNTFINNVSDFISEKIREDNDKKNHVRKLAQDTLHLFGITENKWQVLSEYLFSINDTQVNKKDGKDEKFKKLLDKSNYLIKHPDGDEYACSGLNYSAMVTKCREYEKNMHIFEQQIKEIKQHFISFIDQYLIENQNKTESHGSKYQVMQALKQYCEDGNIEKLNAACENNSGWNKGIFSRVKTLHKQIIKLEDTVTSQNTLSFS